VAGDDDQHPDGDAPAPWHNSTAKVFGASIAALAGVGLIVGSVMYVSGQADEPTQAPLNFVDPSFSAAPETSSSSQPTTTSATRTTPPLTTDIDLPPSSSETPPTSSPPSTSRRLPSTKEDVPDDPDEDSEPTSTRNRPRLNETRTLYPRP